MEVASIFPEQISILWDNTMAFVSLMVFIALGVGLVSRSMAVASFGAFLVFLVITIETQIDYMVNILYIVLVLIAIGMAMKLWRLEGAGEV